MTLKNSKSNIVLVGFMASGKSRIGELLARHFKFNLFDLDKIIEQDENLCINDIFAQKGEWYFRRLEFLAIKKLMGCINTVIVAGAGAPMWFENAQMLKKLGQIFYLDASFSLILQRLANNNARPLGKIKSLDDLEQIKRLYIFRRPIYLNLGSVIDVNNENKTTTCEEIITRFEACNRLAHIPTTTIHTEQKPYKIFHQPYALNGINNIIISSGLRDHEPVLITSDKLYKILNSAIDAINQSLQKKIPIIIIPDGEQYKTNESINKIHEEMFQLSLTRKTLIIALGGGNIGDVAGFASSTYLRGIPFFQVPTTLLAMIDASIGGKTGVDNYFGKNLIGAFYNPTAIIIDITVLNTLPKEDFSSGIAEVIKHAIIADRDFFYQLKNQNFDLMSMIIRALKIKADIVFSDPKESNIRAHLNLGHTFAHAIEKVSNYKIKHGHAVAIGLVMAANLSQSLGLLKEDFRSDLKVLLKKFNLPFALPSDIDQQDLLVAMKFDKKRDSNGLKFILPKKLGQVIVQYVDEQNIFRS
jgi:shikimate kinase / 3-dehydroquinate synthase